VFRRIFGSTAMLLRWGRTYGKSTQSPVAGALNRLFTNKMFIAFGGSQTNYLVVENKCSERIANIPMKGYASFDAGRKL